MPALQVGLGESGELQVFAHDIVEPIQFLQNRTDQAVRLFTGFFQFVFEQFDIEHDGTQRIPDLMSDLRREAADRRQPLGLDQAFFHRAKIGAILKHVHVPHVLAIVDALHGHVHDLSLALARANDQGLVEAMDAAAGLLDQFVVGILHWIKIAHLPAL